MRLLSFGYASNGLRPYLPRFLVTQNEMVKAATMGIGLSLLVCFIVLLRLACTVSAGVEKPAQFSEARYMSLGLRAFRLSSMLPRFSCKATLFSVASICLQLGGLWSSKVPASFTLDC